MNSLKQKFLNLFKELLPYTWYRYIVFLCKRIKFMGKEWPYTEEYFEKWRPFSRKKYYIVRLEYPVYAHFSAAKNYFPVAENAKDKGMRPFLLLQWQSDMKKKNLCEKNEWELLFRQKSMKEILDENATILVSRVNVDAYEIMRESKTFKEINGDPTDYTIHATEVEWKNYYRNVHRYTRQYWKFNRNILVEAHKKYVELFQSEGNILGVALRENFSEEFNALIKNRDAKRTYRLHPLGPSLNEILDMVEEYLEMWGCDKIFIASIYSDSIEKFEDRFPGRVIFCERERLKMMDVIEGINARRKYIDESLGENIVYRNQQHRIAKGYAQETILLSKCTYLIGAKSGQAIAALTLNGGRYNDIKILEDKNHIKTY